MLQRQQQKFFKFCVLLFTLLIGNQAATAADLTEQMRRPLNNSYAQEFRDEADQLLRIGGKQQQQGSLSKAIESWSQALLIYQNIGDVKAKGMTYDFLGMAYAQQGRFREAEDAWRKRLAIARDNQDFQGQIFGLNNIGTLLLQKGESRAAAQTYAEALSIARSIDHTAGLGLSLSNLGLVATRLGNSNQAIKLLEQALTYRRQTGDGIGEANTLNNLGDAYSLAENHQDTISSYGLALRIAVANLDHPNQLRAIDGLITDHTTTKHYNRAADLLQQRLFIAQELKSPEQEMISWESFGEFSEQQGNYPAARDYYQKAIALARTLQDNKQELILIDKLTKISHK
jgi:tetratricopeptide (TPR) repeat protein